jgi:putative radical SAM enzyme (TIGR03279 family)
MAATEVQITAVTAGSPAERVGITAGSLLLSVNGRPVEDALGLRFVETASRVDVAWRDAEGRDHRARIVKLEDQPIGVEAAPLKMHACNNKCVFCFAFQNARGMRRALYFKDDDFRFSFLNGNFATLTNLTLADVERIVAQRLSPLYVSVHATDRELRNRLLGNPKAPDILEQIAVFAKGRIRMHTQVVLCPGLNDGVQLEKTLADLAKFHPFLETVALVPVGLTQYRERLPVLRSPDPAYARELLDWAEPWRRRFRRELGTRLAFPSDEFYLLAERPFPAAAAYEGYAQLGNGVGGCRKFLEEFRRRAPRLPKRLAAARCVTVVTGRLAVPVLSWAIERLNEIEGLSVRLAPVPNQFFGGSVTCAGLLTGQDIRRTLEAEPLGDVILIPSVTFKEDEDIFLDDVSLADLAAHLARPVLRVEATPASLIAACVRQITE